jgi:predicted amidohydrolase
MTITIGATTMTHASLAADAVYPDDNMARLEEAGRLVERAAALGCDFCCLPELFADPSQGLEMTRWAEDHGGPINTWLSQTAAAHRMNLVTSLALNQKRGITNTAVIYDRAGKLAGAYDKVHLPPGECDMATGGDAFPVFDVDGVRIGLQVCHDLQYPESCRMLAVAGAEIVFWPNMWGDGPYDRTAFVMRTRAFENVCVLVSAAFLLASADFRLTSIHGRSGIVDWTGVMLSEVGCQTGVAVATVDIEALRTLRSTNNLHALANRPAALYAGLSAPEGGQS